MKNILKSRWFWGILVFLFLFTLSTGGRILYVPVLLLVVYALLTKEKNKQRSLAIGAGIIIFYALIYLFMLIFI